MLQMLSRLGPRQARRKRGKFRSDTSGTTAVEFGFVGIPFLMMCFGIITVGLHFLTTYSLENAVERAGRMLRTGQAQQQNWSVSRFKQEICDNVAGYMDCNNKIRVFVQSWTDFVSIAPQSCIGPDGNLAPPSGSDADPIANNSGGANAVVLITACYEWELAANLPFLRLGKMTNGSALIQAATTFRTEPYQ